VYLWKARERGGALMFNIIVGIIGALMHPIVTVQAWWDTLAERGKDKPPPE
jgi:uncharacterized membrane protein YeaQ/YmgE (transglycosylase-associated protein family)